MPKITTEQMAQQIMSYVEHCDVPALIELYNKTVAKEQQVSLEEVELSI